MNEPQEGVQQQLPAQGQTVANESAPDCFPHLTVASGEW